MKGEFQLGDYLRNLFLPTCLYHTWPCFEKDGFVHYTFATVQKPYNYLSMNQLPTFNLNTHWMKRRLLGVVENQTSSPFKIWMTLVRKRMILKYKFDSKRKSFSTRWNQYLFTLKNNAQHIYIFLQLFILILILLINSTINIGKMLYVNFWIFLDV